MTIYIQILVMAVVTYLVRAVPLIFLKNGIQSRFIRSFLHYVPYVTLSVMTFPAIISASGNSQAGFIGFAVAVLVALVKGSLPLVAFCCCLSVYLAQLVL